MAPTLYLIRHGETEANRQGVIAGQNDSPLTPEGLVQAAENGRLLSELEPDLGRFAFWSSPLHRTVATLGIVLREAAVEPQAFTTDRRLMELDHGDWTGLPYGTVQRLRAQKAQDEGVDGWHTKSPHGESWADLHARTGRFLSMMQGPAVIVAHGGSLRMIRGHLLGLGPDAILSYAPPNAGLWRFAHGVETLFGV